jgi:2-methylcitrate dehydratase
MTPIPPITREIAQRVANTRLDDIPESVVAYSKTLTMSALGAMLAGPQSAGSDIVTRYVKRAGGTAEASVFGANYKTSVEWAALANATYAHATEYEDDSFPEAVSSYTLFPAIFALGQHLHSNGRTALEAFVVAYETQARIGIACREARRLGYMVLALAGALGCAAAAARLLGLDEKRTAHALSIAASQGSGVGYQTGSMAHIAEMGFAARNGITAALLAADGFTGQLDVLEAPRGLLNLITAGKVDNAAGILNDWGRPYRLLEVGIKQYPCCYHLQRMIESTLEQKEAGRISADSIAEIVIEVNAFFPTVVQYLEPRNEIEAQFSLPHAVAAALLETAHSAVELFNGKNRKPRVPRSTLESADGCARGLGLDADWLDAADHLSLGCGQGVVDRAATLEGATAESFQLRPVHRKVSRLRRGIAAGRPNRAIGRDHALTGVL